MSFSQLYPIPPQSHSTIHTSVILRRLIDNAPPDTFTLNWVVENMPNRSYGIIILFLGLISFIPIISIFSRLLIMLFALQIILGFHRPALPERIMMRALPSRHLRRLPPYTISALTYVEKTIRPRWEPYLGVRRLSRSNRFSHITRFASCPCALCECAGSGGYRAYGACLSGA